MTVWEQTDKAFKYVLKKHDGIDYYPETVVYQMEDGTDVNLIRFTFDGDNMTEKEFKHIADKYPLALIDFTYGVNVRFEIERAESNFFKLHF